METMTQAHEAGGGDGSFSCAAKADTSCVSHDSGKETRSEADSSCSDSSKPLATKAYFEELVHDRTQLQAFSTPHPCFQHLDKLLESEIERVECEVLKAEEEERKKMAKDEHVLPEGKGEIVRLHEKLFAPVNKYPDYNFAGRILGPRGMTVKQLEQKTGCKILVRGRGSMKNQGPWRGQRENVDLHVIVSVEDHKNRAEIKLKHAVNEVKKLMLPGDDGMDSLKKKQLMELAIINGTYRPPLQFGHQKPGERSKLAQNLVGATGNFKSLQLKPPGARKPMSPDVNAPLCPIQTQTILPIPNAMDGCMAPQSMPPYVYWPTGQGPHQYVHPGMGSYLVPFHPQQPGQFLPAMPESAGFGPNIIMDGKLLQIPNPGGSGDALMVVDVDQLINNFSENAKIVAVS